MTRLLVNRVVSSSAVRLFPPPQRCMWLMNGCFENSEHRQPLLQQQADFKEHSDLLNYQCILFPSAVTNISLYANDHSHHIFQIISTTETCVF